MTVRMEGEYLVNMASRKTFANANGSKLKTHTSVHEKEV